MGHGDVSCTTHPPVKRQVVCNKLHGVGELGLLAFTTSIGKTKAADLKHDAAYVQVDSPTVGNMHFMANPGAFAAANDDRVKMVCLFFCATRSDGNGGMNMNAKMSAKEVKIGDATVTVPMIVNTKKIAKGEMVVVHVPAPTESLQTAAKAKA